MKRMLNIWLPNWPIQRLLVARPELKTVALVLHSSDPRKGSCVTACCDRSLQAGVRWSMPLAEVSALFSQPARSKNQPELVCELHDTREDFTQLVELAQWCEPFSPHVGTEPLDHSYSIRVPGGQHKPVHTADSLVLDVTKLDHLFGSEQQLVQQISHNFQQLGYHTHIGVGHSIAAAWLAAHWLADDGQRILPARLTLADEKEMAVLPLEALRLPGEILSRFAELGIREIGQLQQLPRDCLHSRFGDLVGLRLDQLTGHADEVLKAQQPLPDFQVEWPLEPPTDRSDVIEQVLQQLTVQLTTLLRQHDLGVVELHCDLSGQGGPWPLQVRLFQPSATANHIWDLLRLQSEQLVLPAPVSCIRLCASRTAPFERHQGQLFAGQASSDWSLRLAQLVNRLSSRLGNYSVIRPRLQQDAQPEQAWYPLPWTGKKPRARPKASPPASAAWRPLHLHRDPLQLQVSLPSPRSQPPQHFHDRGHHHKVARYWGPERVETGWWRGHSIRRDYYRIETTTGNRFWVFQQLNDGCWFLHGEYL